MRQNMNHPNPIVRLASLRALMLIQPGESRLAAVAVPLLIRGLDDERELVRAESATALGELGELGKRALPQLKRLLQDASPMVREQAAEAVQRLGG